MSDSASRVFAELMTLGLQPYMHQARGEPLVCLEYEIETGSYAGATVTIGLRFQEEGYPEYPPHWIHVSPPLDDGQGGVTERYSDADGREWIAMSRPPGDMWDRLPTKHMSYFISEHLRRVFRII